ncbi:MAG: hypothetical protein R3A46_06235 [Thermomicrobiales bacterium]
MSGSERFAISRSRWAAPLLVLLTATESRSWVELRPSCLRVRYGWYQLDIPYDTIKTVKPSDWPWYAGIGWRTNLRSVIGLIGSYRGVVRIDLAPPQPTRLLGIPIKLSQLYVSLEDAAGFMDALDQRRRETHQR